MAGISDSKKKTEFGALHGQAQNMTFYLTTPPFLTEVVQVVLK